MKSNFILLVLTVSATMVFAQRPKWTKSTPVSESGSYDYFVGRGDNDNEAYDNVVDAVCKKRCVDSVGGKIGRTVTAGDGGRKIEINRSVQVKCDCGSDLYIRKVDEYTDRDRYYILVSVSKNGNSSGRALSRSDFVWRSAVAPGWGQFYNKESKKGLFFSLGEVALIGATLYSFGQAGNEADNAELAFLGGNIAQYNSFKQSEDNWKTTGTILGISAGALWILNIIDATSSKKNLYAMNRKKGLGLLASGNNFGLKYSF